MVGPENLGCLACGSSIHRFDQLPGEYVYLLGLYLGDGYLAAHPRGVYRLRISLDARHVNIANECCEAMRTVMPGSRVGRVRGRGNCLEIYSYSKAWPCLFPQHGAGRKHHRLIQLHEWQLRLVDDSPEPLLRGLIHSDGCRFQNTGRKGWSHPRYDFQNESADIRAIFCDACDRLGLRWTESGGNRIYVSRKADVAKLDEFVGPKT